MNNKPLMLVASVILILIAVAVGVVVLDKKGSGEALPVERYFESSVNFVGNHYQLVARVERQLGTQEGIGRLILLRAVDSDRRLPVLIPENVGINIEAGVQYQFQIWIRQTKGMVVPEIQSVRKL